MNGPIYEVHGISLIERDDAVVAADKREGPFEDAAVKAWVAGLRPGCVALDVGMYTGLYSMIAANHACVRVVAFEPNTHAIDRAMRNFELNGLEDQIEVNYCAVSDHLSGAQLYLRDGRCLTSAATIARDEGFPRAVPTNTLDVWWRDQDQPLVSAIKIDVERAEIAVLRGARELIKENRPRIILEALEVPLLYEIHEELKDALPNMHWLTPTMVMFCE
jgi:FkbM family methyltransferase